MSMKELFGKTQIPYTEAGSEERSAPSPLPCLAVEKEAIGTVRSRCLLCERLLEHHSACPRHPATQKSAMKRYLFGSRHFREGKSHSDFTPEQRRDQSLLLGFEIAVTKFIPG